MIRRATTAVRNQRRLVARIDYECPSYSFILLSVDPVAVIDCGLMRFFGACRPALYWYEIDWDAVLPSQLAYVNARSRKPVQMLRGAE